MTPPNKSIEQVSQCCGKEKVANYSDEGTGCYLCQGCLGEFIPQSKDPIQTGYLETQGGHCFKCHKDYAKEDHSHIIYCKERVEVNKDGGAVACGKLNGRGCEFQSKECKHGFIECELCDAFEELGIESKEEKKHIRKCDMKDFGFCTDFGKNCPDYVSSPTPSTSTEEKCGYGCNRAWNEEGNENGFENCPSSYHIKSGISSNQNVINNTDVSPYTEHTPDVYQTHTSDIGSTIECEKCHRTSVVVNLSDKCPFCSPSTGWEKNLREDWKMVEKEYPFIAVTQAPDWWITNIKKILSSQQNELKPELELRQCTQCFTMKNFGIHSTEKLCFRCIDRNDIKGEVENELRSKIEGMKKEEETFLSNEVIGRYTYSEIAQNKAYNQAVDDILALIKEK